ncbi:MAG: GNAT family N-acetyltransferase [Lachnospiraceae bacterium]|nr:GNAT family N-acetyltransferase [Lachnospiraceae bacterium]
MELMKINQENRDRINDFIMHQWFTMQMVVHGESIDLSKAEGWYASEDNEIIGLVTYRFTGNDMEILSLDSLVENKGTGTALLHQAISEARNAGFDMICFYQNALDDARKIKPEIPLTGIDEIPLKHEIELELLLG